jgi:endonuclease/exonuclease/phosphatase family metal-dependent hydrolase
MARRRRRRRSWSHQFPSPRPRRFPYRARSDSQRALFALVFVLLIALAAHRLWRERPWATQRPVGSVPATRPTTPARPIRIATWNLRKFSDRARPDLVTIASLIKSNAFDLLAVQEVQQQGQTVQRLRMALGEPWRHVISDQTGNHERFAFLYRADVIETVTEPALVASPEAVHFDRVPFAGTFRAGQFDFTLVTVHSWYGDANFNARRAQETRALARVCESLLATSPEKDLILLGDFNEFRTGGNFHYLAAIDFVPLNFTPTNLSSTEAYDNILINRTPTREYANVSGVLLFDETHFADDDKRAADDVSDHRPVFADFHTTLPDDD